MGNDRLDNQYAGEIISKAVTNSRYLLENLVDFIDSLGKETYPRALSLGTLQTRDEARQVIRLMELCEQLGYEEEYFKWQERASVLTNDLMDELNSMAPGGTYFGSHEGDGALFGFWPIDRNAAEEFGLVSSNNEDKVA